MSRPEYFLIAGATGRQGGAVVAALLHDSPPIKPENILAITRDAKGASAQHLASKGIRLITGDLKDSSAIFQQVDKAVMPKTAVFLAQSHGPTELSDAKTFIDAAIGNKVSYFVYSSVDRGGKKLSDRDASYCKTFSDKYHIEQHLRAAAAGSETKGRRTGYTILRPTWFADNADWGFNGRLCMTAWRDIMKGKRLQVTVTKDIGRWALEGLIRPDNAGIRDEAVSIASDELDFDEVDQIFRQESGEPVGMAYGWLTRLMVWMIKDLSTMFAWIDERPYGADMKWLATHVEPTTFRQWVKDSVAKRAGR